MKIKAFSQIAFSHMTSNKSFMNKYSFHLTINANQIVWQYKILLVIYLTLLAFLYGYIVSPNELIFTYCYFAFLILWIISCNEKVGIK